MDIDDRLFEKEVRKSLLNQGYSKEKVEKIWVDVQSPLVQCVDAPYSYDIRYNKSRLEGALSNYEVVMMIFPSQAYGGGDAMHIEWKHAPKKTNDYTYNKADGIYTNNETGNALLASLYFGGYGNEISREVVQSTIISIFCTKLPDNYSHEDVVITNCRFPIDFTQGAGYSTIDTTYGNSTIELQNPTKYLATDKAQQYRK